MINVIEKIINLGFLIISSYFCWKSLLRPSYIPFEFFVATSAVLLALLFNVDKIIMSFINSIYDWSAVEYTNHPALNQRSVTPAATLSESLDTSKTKIDLGANSLLGDSNILDTLSSDDIRDIAKSETDHSQHVEFNNKNIETKKILLKFKVIPLWTKSDQYSELGTVDSILLDSPVNQRRLLITDLHRKKSSRSTLMKALGGSPLNKVICKNVCQKADLIPYTGAVTTTNLESLVSFLLNEQNNYDEIIFVMPNFNFDFWTSLADQMNHLSDESINFDKSSDLTQQGLQVDLSEKSTSGTNL